jgi:hypothetical protein
MSARMQSPPNRAVKKGFKYQEFFVDHVLMLSTDVRRIDSGIETLLRQDPEGNKGLIDRLRKHRDEVAE